MPWTTFSAVASVPSRMTIGRFPQSLLIWRNSSLPLGMDESMTARNWNSERLVGRGLSMRAAKVGMYEEATKSAVLNPRPLSS